MAEAIEELEALSADAARLSAVVGTRKKNVPPALTQGFVARIARVYFKSVRPELEAVAERRALLEEIDGTLHTLLGLAAKTSEKQAYVDRLAQLTAMLLEANVALMKAAGKLVLSPTEKAILGTLTKMLPVSAAAYEQTLRDIAQANKVSWRGTASEIREVLREVIDHVAPAADVMASPGFQLEQDQTRPTQRQKVRYILLLRKKSGPQIAVAEQALTTADEAVANLARGTYTLGSAATHAAADVKAVRELKRYVEPLLCQLLEIA